MTNSIIGQYYPADSLLHRLDARLKLFASLVYITMLFTLNDVYGFVFTFLCLSMVIYLSKVPVKYMIKGLKALIFIIVFTVVLNVFFSTGEKVLFEAWKIRVTLEGIYITVKMSTRLIMLVVGASILTLTTSPLQLTDAIEFYLKPFSKIGVPSHEIAMMMTIALRFIPTLLEEMDKIRKAQTARGADFDTGGVIKKAKSLIPLLVPLFVSAFRRADELAIAMEARCYRGGGGRTKMKIMKFEPCDYKGLLFVCLFTGIIIIINIF